MRSKLASTLRKDFKICLNRKLPTFSEVSTDELPAGSRLYSARVSSNLLFHLILLLNSKHEWFTLEVAWSQDEKLPFFSINTDLNEITKSKKARFRISNLFPKPQSDFWWQLEPAESIEELRRKLRERDFKERPVNEAEPYLIPLVENAIDKVVQYAVPCFQEIAEVNGYKIELLHKE